MRTELIWKERVRERVIKRLFPPRIQRDLQEIETPKDLPDTVEGMYIHGPSHHGKTIYAAFLLLQEEKRLYLNNISGECLFVNTSELFQKIKDAMDSKEGMTSQALIQHYQRVHLLVLDDFGTVKPTDWVYQTLYLIINYRYEHLLPTVYTANQTLPEVANTFGDDRITSRIERQGKVVRKRHFQK